jgi:hypothetical protein
MKSSTAKSVQWKKDNDSGTSDTGASPACTSNDPLPPQKLSREEAGPPRTASLYRLASRTDGWIRIAPDGEGKAVYIKYKFTHGPFAGRYVMVLAQLEQMRWAFDLLEEKIEEVEQGVRSAIVDRFYQ